jgi:hypothetical protein
MTLRRFIVFTVFLLMLAAAPVWANTTAIPDLPRIDDSVTIDGSLDDYRSYFLNQNWVRLDAVNKGLPGVRGLGPGNATRLESGE